MDIAVMNPANGAVISTLQGVDRQQVHNAIARAKNAQAQWATRSAHERARILHAWYALIMQQKQHLARILTEEQGKPLAEAEGEIVYAASFIQWCAEEGKRLYGRVVPSPAAGVEITVSHEPVGVCGIITPWNFPAAMITRKVAAAFAAGCAVVVKPAHETPLTAIALQKLAHEAGLPEGVFEVVVGEASMIGEVFTSHPDVAKLSFTGSTAVGRLLMQQAAPSLKRLSLELGGNAPFIVFPSANLAGAVKGVMASKFRNAGQTCVCANRMLVHRSLREKIIPLLLEQIARLKTGNGMDEGVTIGPLITPKAVEKVTTLMQDALDKGAKKLCGGGVNGQFVEPALLVDVPVDAHMFREEIFGPVLAVYFFDDEQQAVQLANNTEYGLAAYFYSQDAGQIMRVKQALAYGMVGVNTGMVSTEVAPFGGVKQSGFGREGAAEGIMEYVNVKASHYHWG